MSNKYSKAELNKFKKSIEHKISLIANEVDTIKDFDFIKYEINQSKFDIILAN